MPEIKPVATFLERGKVITWEFISPDGHVLAGYRSVPEATGFPAWEQCGDLIMGFSERVLRWFPTEDAARTWVLSRVSVAHPSAAAADVVSGSTQQEKAA
jgi:hypothetical protein